MDKAESQKLQGSPNIEAAGWGVAGAVHSFINFTSGSSSRSLQ